VRKIPVVRAGYGGSDTLLLRLFLPLLLRKARNSLYHCSTACDRCSPYRIIMHAVIPVCRADIPAEEPGCSWGRVMVAGVVGG